MDSQPTPASPDATPTRRAKPVKKPSRQEPVDDESSDERSERKSKQGHPQDAYDLYWQYSD